MVEYCLVKSCGSQTYRLHRMKINYDGPQPEWMKYVSSSPRYRDRKCVRICSIHFTDDQFKPRSEKRFLIEGAVPTLYLNECPPQDDEFMNKHRPTRKLPRDKKKKREGPKSVDYCLVKKCGATINRIHRIKCNYDEPPPDWMKYLTSTERYKYRKYVKICSVHYADDQFKPRSKKRFLIEGAVPTLYLDEVPPERFDAMKPQKRIAESSQKTQTELVRNECPTDSDSMASVNYCFIKRCGSHTNILHRIKCNDDEDPPEWMKYVTSIDGYENLKFVKICSIHFTDDQFKPKSKNRYLKDGAIPTLYLHEPSPQHYASIKTEDSLHAFEYSDQDLNNSPPNINHYKMEKLDETEEEEDSVEILYENTGEEEYLDLNEDYDDVIEYDNSEVVVDNETENYEIIEETDIIEYESPEIIANQNLNEYEVIQISDGSLRKRRAIIIAYIDN